MADHDMNTYIHAPKNDPYQRLRWRELYPEQTMARFAREVSLAQSRGLSWVPSISPGFPLAEAADEHDQDICFSCPDDRQVLFDKLDQFWAIGVRSFMIGLDDVIKVSSHPEDALAYGVGDYAYGLANADLLNAVLARYRSLDPEFRLFTVPSDYVGVTTTPYLAGLSADLDPAVVVMWTGLLPVSPTIDCTQANGFGAAIGRKPLVWDNFPVNDYAAIQPDPKLMVGPYAGRSADLPACVQGILANPANEVRTNKIPLYTVADYLNDPTTYRAERSWKASLREFGGDQVTLLRRFVENVRSTALDRTEAVRFGKLRDRFLNDLDTASWFLSFQRLHALLQKYIATPDRLRSTFHDQRFIAEIDSSSGMSWLSRLEFSARQGLATASALASTRPRVSATLRRGVLTGRVAPPLNLDEAQAVAQDIGQMPTRDDGNPDNVFGDRVFNALGPTYAAQNRMDEFFTLAFARLGQYLPTAALASQQVTLSINGVSVPLAQDGRFSVEIAGPVARSVVTDGAGQQTFRRFGAAAAKER